MTLDPHRQRLVAAQDGHSDLEQPLRGFVQLGAAGGEVGAVVQRAGGDAVLDVDLVVGEMLQELEHARHRVHPIRGVETLASRQTVVDVVGAIDRLRSSGDVLANLIARQSAAQHQHAVLEASVEAGRSEVGDGDVGGDVGHPIRRPHRGQKGIEVLLIGRRARDLHARALRPNASLRDHRQERQPARCTLDGATAAQQPQGRRRLRSRCLGRRRERRR